MLMLIFLMYVITINVTDDIQKFLSFILIYYTTYS